MSSAFDEENGPLADKALLAPERQAEKMLFMGAIGRYKNPSSHRTIDVDKPEVAAEIILFASHLLRVVDSRTAPST